ncbi:MAG: hypothetical protein U1E45_00625 [Geminicoccaceae bacterium]
MSRRLRTLYKSSNGDQWLLLQEAADEPLVMHVAAAASGGYVTKFAIGEFLSRDGQAPQGRALFDLIATLLDHAEAEPGRGSART